MSKSPDASQCQADLTADFETDLVALIPALQRFARSLTKTDAIDDLVQETVYKALRNRHQFVPGTKLKSWLFTILRHHFCTTCTTGNRERPVSAEDLKAPVMPDQEWSLHQAQVIEAIDRLNPDFGKALILVGEGQSYEEVANQCECEVGTIKSRVSRARQRLNREFGGIFEATKPYSDFAHH